jgi:hypothetical protein
MKKMLSLVFMMPLIMRTQNADGAQQLAKLVIVQKPVHHAGQIEN